MILCIFADVIITNHSVRYFIMRYLLAILSLFVAVASKAESRLSVVDGEDSSPLAGATVFARSGVIIGMTDGKGEIIVPSANDYPLTVKCLGYEPAVCPTGISEARMSPSLFSLHEVTVTPVDRPVVRVICYIREYVSGATGTDTLTCFNEHMGDFFLPLRKKVKGFKAKPSPRFISSRLRSRMSDRNGLDSVFVPAYRDDSFSWEMVVGMPYGNVSESETIRAGARCDSVQGKHGLKRILRKSGASTYSIQTDYLADSKDHRLSPFIFKLLGMSIDFNELQGSWVYKANDKGVYTPADIVSGTFSLSVVGRGKWIKKAFKSDTPVQMYSFYEIYPVEAEYLTVDEAKALIKDDTLRMKITPSPNARPLEPGIQRIVDRCTTYRH